MPQQPNYSLLPELLRPGMKRYVEQGILPGDFLEAVLSNDLVQASLRADEGNAASMRLIAQFLINEIPRHAWGNREKLLAWSNAKRRS